MDDIFHVIPVNDIWSHLESDDCECEPRIEEDGHVIVHNSYDGRELIEEVDRILDRTNLNNGGN